jgi:hypothetical protein
MYLKLSTLQLQFDCAVAALKAAKRMRGVGSDVRKAVDTALEAIDKLA